jgi:DNA-binding CsgD family transcriptional regulator
VNKSSEFIEWLGFDPTGDEIARALSTDYLNEFAVQGIRFSSLQSDDSILILGEFGFENSHEWADRRIPAIEWRARNTEPARVLKGESREKWCNGSTVYLETLRHRGLTQGHMMISFHKEVSSSDKARAANTIEDLCVSLALYLSFRNRSFIQTSLGSASLSFSRDSGVGHLSARQLLILRGMVEGKTNNELATQMGFSVSTVRHETMRIYQALSVSDRKEAAKKALTLNLI